jgi:hypothetical protein
VSSSLMLRRLSWIVGILLDEPWGSAWASHGAARGRGVGQRVDEPWGRGLAGNARGVYSARPGIAVESGTAHRRVACASGTGGSRHHGRSIDMGSRGQRLRSLLGHHSRDRGDRDPRITSARWLDPAETAVAGATRRRGAVTRVAALVRGARSAACPRRTRLVCTRNIAARARRGDPPIDSDSFPRAARPRAARRPGSHGSRGRTATAGMRRGTTAPLPRPRNLSRDCPAGPRGGRRTCVEHPSRCRRPRSRRRSLSAHARRLHAGSSRGRAGGGVASASLASRVRRTGSLSGGALASPDRVMLG